MTPPHVHCDNPLVRIVLLILLCAGRVDGTGGQERAPLSGHRPGHFITTMRDAGRFVTLEDKSQWEIAEADRHLTAAWQEMEGISIRYAGGADAFTYEIDNLDRDEGASARWIRAAP